ncbi:MAG: prepilin peptidase [Alphaproteobacteria bacterium]|nr:MAG: prepilin peptidase [Alphaproteobacteria bacterium]
MEPLVFELATLAIAGQVLFLADLHGMDALLVTVAGGLLLALSVIDARHLLIPDGASLGLVILGLLEAAVAAVPPGLVDRLIGAGAGWMVFVLIESGYRRLRARDGLGRGDAKLFAAAGAWLGWQGLPVVLGLASLAALLFVGLRALHERRLPEASRAIAFGPFLALGLWGALLVARAPLLELAFAPL